MTWVNAVLQGILLGGLYALFACGLSLMFGVMRIINLAHGDLAIAAAFLTSTLVTALGISPWIGLFIILPGAGLVGFALQRGILTRSLRAGELTPLLATFGLSIVIENLLQQTYSANSRGLNAGAIGSASWRISSQLSVPALGALTFAIAVALLLGLQGMLSRTGLGRAMRATALDPDTAGLVGINTQRMFATATAIAVATAALAGVLFAMRTTFDPFAGGPQLIFAFEAVIIGGLGNLWGTLVGGVVLGVAQTVGAQIDPAYSVLAGHLVFLAILAVRPRGILAAQVRA
jgi:branched-chain amino acid transport system permease protein